MIILLSVVIVIVLALVVVSNTEEMDGWNMTSSVIGLLSAVCLVILLIAIPVGHAEGKSGIQKYNAVKSTIDNSRQEGVSDVERAALTNTIIEVNSEIASAKYWNDTLMDIWIYDGFAELEYLE